MYDRLINEDYNGCYLDKIKQDTEQIYRKVKKNAYLDLKL